MSAVTYWDPEGVQRTATYWAEAPSAPGFVRCQYVRRDGLWIVIGTGTKDRKIRQIVATDRPGQALEHTGDGFAVIDGPRS